MRSVYLPVLIAVLALFGAGAHAQQVSLVKDINPHHRDSVNDARYFRVLGNRLFFAARTTDRDFELWSSDGTQGGTRVVTNIPINYNPFQLSTYTGLGTNAKEFNPGLVELNGSYYFMAAENNNLNYPYPDAKSLILYKTDGVHGQSVVRRGITTDAGIALQRQLYAPKSGHELGTLNGKLLFPGGDASRPNSCEPWISDGTPAGTALLRQLNTTGYSSNPTGFTTVGSTCYFVATDSGKTRNALFKTDGTSAGTQLVKVLGNGTAFGKFVAAGSRVYFIEYNNGLRVWASDGTAAGTDIVAQASMAPSLVPFYPIVSDGSKCYFLNSGITDCTPGNVHKVETHAVNGGQCMDVWNGDLYYAIADSLMKLNLATGATNLVAELSEQPIGIGAAQGGVYPYSRQKAWFSDGTAAGTRQVSSQRIANTAATQALCAPVGNKLVFAGPVVGSSTLLSADPAGSDAQVITMPAPSTESSFPREYFSWNGAVYFNASDGEHGDELWRTDGTAAGTYLLKDLDPSKSYQYSGIQVSYNHYRYNEGNGEPHAFTPFKGKLCFLAQDSSGVALWQTDGTAGGTVRVFSDGNPYNPSYFYNNFICASGDGLYFVAGNANTLYKYSGSGTPVAIDTTSYTNPFSQLVASGSNLYYFKGRRLFVASLAGNPNAHLLKAIAPDRVINTYDCVTQMLDHNGILFFAGDDSVHGLELWRTDGTSAGTWLIDDVSTAGGSQKSSSPSQLLNYGNQVVYVPLENDQDLTPSAQGTNKVVVLATDGTPGSTHILQQFPVKDAPTDPIVTYDYYRGFVPQNLGRLGNKLFASVVDTAKVQRIWTNGGDTVRPWTPLAGIAGDSSVLRPEPLVGFGFAPADSLMFFAAASLQNGTEIYVGDMTPNRIRIAAQTLPGGASLDPEGMIVLGDRLLFSAQDGTYGQELYSIDMVARILSSNGVRDAAQKRPSLAIFPNPAQDQVRITGTDLVSVSVFTIAGVLVREMAADRASGCVLDAQSLVPGTYVIIAADAQGGRQWGKLIRR